ncbi:MAG: AI-2E family transporter [Segetibacter sp.]
MHDYNFIFTAIRFHTGSVVSCIWCIILCQAIFGTLAFGLVFSTLFYPLCKWMEEKGISRGLSSFICVFSFVSLIGAIVLLLVWQLSGMASEMTGIEENANNLIEKIQTWLENLVGVPKEKQQQFLQKQKQSGGSKLGSVISTLMKSLSSFLVDTVLTLVYIFLLLFFRTHLKKQF